MWDEHPVMTIFTKAELQQLGMLELANAQRASLTNAIHPIFGQSSWVNVRVAHHIQLRPVLRLASHFITDPQLLPYWHAQIFGQRFDIPRNIVVGPIYGHTLSFFQRTYDINKHTFALNNLDLVRTRDAFVSLAGVITFTINREPSQTGAVFSTLRDFDAASPTSFPGTASLIELDRKFLDAYARHDLTVSQRLRLQFFLATSLVHEVGHPRIPSLSCLSDGTVRFPRCLESYFLQFGGEQGLTDSYSSRMALKMRSRPCCRDPQTDMDQRTGDIVITPRSRSSSGTALPNADTRGKIPSLVESKTFSIRK